MGWWWWRRTLLLYFYKFYYYDPRSRDMHFAIVCLFARREWMDKIASNATFVGTAVRWSSVLCCSSSLMMIAYGYSYIYATCNMCYFCLMSLFISFTCRWMKRNSERLQNMRYSFLFTSALCFHTIRCVGSRFSLFIVTDGCLVERTLHFGWECERYFWNYRRRELLGLEIFCMFIGFPKTLLKNEAFLCKKANRFCRFSATFYYVWSD